jgi:hypothetical protein
MKKILFLTYLFLLTLSIPLKGQALLEENAPNLVFTDVSGVSHNLHEYLDQGFKVILDFSYQACGPCKFWAQDVGHVLWQTYGPDGDNTLRMFHMDVKPNYSDEQVINYTEEWGVEYPVVNLPSTIQEYPSSSFPSIYFICSDKVYYQGGQSLDIAEYFFYKYCEGVDLENNYQFYSVTPANPSTLCNATPLHYTPQLKVNRTNNYLWLDDSGEPFHNPYEVQIHINGEYHSTQTVTPFSDNNVNSSYDDSTLEPIPVSPGDEVTMSIDFEGDNYPDDDAITVSIPSNISTPTSANTKLIVNGSSTHNIYKSNGEKIIAYGISGEEFELPAASCYSIDFYGNKFNPVMLKDAVTLENLILINEGEYEQVFTPRFYFNVVSTSGISENGLNNKKVVESYFVNLLGKRLAVSDFENLNQGLFLKITQYENGEIITKKVVKR